MEIGNWKFRVAEVIPSINVRTFEEVKERIRLIEPHVSWCHLDVTDGVFSSHETWRNPRDLLNLETSLNVEVHLMVSSPDDVIDDWLVTPVKRVIIHTEAVKNFDLILEKCRDREIELGIAVNPETPLETLKPYFGKADLLLVLAVKPGPSGQEMHENTMGKIADIRRSCPGCMIEVDGGVNLEMAKEAVRAGANLLVAGNYIFNYQGVDTAIKELSAHI